MMGLLDFNADTIRANALRDLANPGPAPEPSFNVAAMLSSGFKAPAAGMLDMLGSFSDLMGSSSERQFEGNPLANSEYEKKRREEVKAKLQAAGPMFRKKADEFMPDPLTAHWSTQAVAGFTRVASKAVTDMALLGPTGGALALGVDEANNTSQRLQDKGIDPETAWQVGGVTGLFTAAGVRLPMFGTTALRTAGLAALGGPLSYMAQEGLSREILQRADYGEEAGKHDPFDPLGLSIATATSVLFGGIGYRFNVKAKVKRTKAEDQMAKEAQFTPQELAQQDADLRSEASLAELRKAIASEKDPKAKAALQEELAFQEAAAAKALRERGADRAASNPDAVDAARVSLLDQTLARSLPADEPGAHGMVMRAADMVAAGERVDVPHAKPIEALHGSNAEFDQFKIMPDRNPALFFSETGTGRKTQAEHISEGPFGGMLYKVDIERGKPFNPYDDPKAAAIFERLFPDRKTKTVEYPDIYIDSPLVQAMKEEGYNRVRVYEPSVQGFSIAVTDPALVKITGRKNVKKGGEWEDASAAAPRTESMPEMPATRETTSTVEAARKAWADIQASGEPVAEAVGKLNAPGEVRNLVVGLSEAGADKAKADRVTRAFEREAMRNPDKPLVDASADAVEKVRSGADLEEEAAAQQASSAQRAVQQLAEQKPDMQVIMPGDEKPTTLAEALERIKAEQERDMQFGDLVQVAAQCALTGGAAI